MNTLYRSPRYYVWFPAMHSRVDLLLTDPRPEAELFAIAGEVEALIADLERLGNCHDPASPLSRFNQDATHPVPDELREMLRLCQAYRDATLGLFDPWFQEGRCNLSAFLKGYALDRILPLLEKHQVREAIVNMGNSSVMYLHPQPEVSYILTTSGNDSPTRRHIVNPQTGEPIAGHRTISVVTPLVSPDADGTPHAGGALGEVLSTALFIASETQRRHILRQFPQARIKD